MARVALTLLAETVESLPSKIMLSAIFIVNWKLLPLALPRSLSSDWFV